MSKTGHGLPLDCTTVGPTTHTTPRIGASRWIRTCLGGLFAVVLSFFILEKAVAQVPDSRVTVQVCAYDNGSAKDDIAFLYWQRPTGNRQVLFPPGTQSCGIPSCYWDLPGEKICTTVEVEEGSHTLWVEAPRLDVAAEAGASNPNTAAFEVSIGQMEPQRRSWNLTYRAEPPLDSRQWRLYVTPDTVVIDPVVLSVDRATMAEATGTARVSVSTGGVTFEDAREITLTFTGTATEGEDYTVSAKTLTLRAGESSVGANLVAVNDSLAEGNETINVTASGGVIGNPVVTIIDDDMAEFRVSVDRATMAEATGTARVSVSTGGVTFEDAREITLTFTGTATEGEDYTVSAKTLTLRAGESSVGANLVAVNDSLAEGNETINVTASTVEEGVIGEEQVTIRDDDVRGVTVSETALMVKEGDQQGRSFSVKLNSQPTASVSVTPVVPTGADVEVEPETLTFMPTEWNTAKTVVVTAKDDSDADNDPPVTLTFAVAGGGYDAVAVDSVEVIIEEDDQVTVEEKRVVEAAVKTVTASAVANVTTNIGARFSAARGGATVLTLAGQPVFVQKLGLGLAVLDERHGLHWDDGDGFVGAGPSVSVTEFLRSSAFQVALGAAEEGAQPGSLSQWTLWGRGDMLFFDRDSVRTNATTAT